MKKYLNFGTKKGDKNERNQHKNYLNFRAKSCHKSRKKVFLYQKWPKKSQKYKQKKLMLKNLDSNVILLTFFGAKIQMLE